MGPISPQLDLSQQLDGPIRITSEVTEKLEKLNKTLEINLKKMGESTKKLKNSFFYDLVNKIVRFVKFIFSPISMFCNYLSKQLGMSKAEIKPSDSAETEVFKSKIENNI